MDTLTFFYTVVAMDTEIEFLAMSREISCLRTPVIRSISQTRPDYPIGCCYTGTCGDAKEFEFRLGFRFGLKIEFGHGVRRTAAGYPYPVCR